MFQHISIVKKQPGTFNAKMSQETEITYSYGKRIPYCISKLTETLRLEVLNSKSVRDVRIMIIVIYQVAIQLG